MTYIIPCPKCVDQNRQIYRNREEIHGFLGLGGVEFMGEISKGYRISFLR